MGLSCSCSGTGRFLVLSDVSALMYALYIAVPQQYDVILLCYLPHDP